MEQQELPRVVWAPYGPYGEHRFTVVALESDGAYLLKRPGHDAGLFAVSAERCYPSTQSASTLFDIFGEDQ